MSFKYAGKKAMRSIMINDGRLPPQAMSMINKQLMNDGVMKKLNKRNSRYVPKGRTIREQEIANCKKAYGKVIQQKIAYLSKDYRQ